MSVVGSGLWLLAKLPKLLILLLKSDLFVRSLIDLQVDPQNLLIKIINGDLKLIDGLIDLSYLLTYSLFSVLLALALLLHGLDLVPESLLNLLTLFLTLSLLVKFLVDPLFVLLEIVVEGVALELMFLDLGS